MCSTSPQSEPARGDEGAATGGQHLSVMDDGAEDSMMGRWCRVIEVDIGQTALLPRHVHVVLAGRNDVHIHKMVDDGVNDTANQWC